MRLLVLVSASGLSLAHLLMVNEAIAADPSAFIPLSSLNEGDSDPFASIPLMSPPTTDPKAPPTTLDPLSWNPDEPSKVPAPSSASESSSSSRSESGDGSTSSKNNEESKSDMSNKSDVSSGSDNNASADKSGSKSTKSSGSSSSSSSPFEDAEVTFPCTNVSVETIPGSFCVYGVVCSGSFDGACPGRQKGLEEGSHCAEVWNGVHGCRPGTKPTRLRR